MKYLIWTAVLLWPLAAHAQALAGWVTDHQGTPLPGAVVFWEGSSLGAAADEDGWFALSSNGAPGRVVATHVGYRPDTVQVAADQREVHLRLRPNDALEEVLVRGRRDGVLISDINPIKTEQITQAELKKSACCDLAGCFETQTTVQPQTTNVLTNAKELRILGLSGVYNQVLLDGLPMIQGLTYTYGISSVPGTLVDNIHVSKGANSVVQGFESISGQINVETKAPNDDERLLLNAYLNNFMERHLNANYAFGMGQWASRVTLHTVQPAHRIDRDKDGFLDLPLLTRYMVANQWQYASRGTRGWDSRMGVRLLDERRVGGQTAFDARRDVGGTEVYGQAVHLRQPEVWTKTGYRFDARQRVALWASAFHQAQASTFGTVGYNARQTNAYANLQYERTYDGHDLKTGVSFRHLDLGEEVTFTDHTLPRGYAGQYRRVEYIPGVFAEHTARFLQGRLTWIAGLRADHHNDFGWMATPRTLLKYDIAPRSIVRANIGTGWRTVNLFSEHINLLVSSRDIVLEEALRPERAVNMGVNFTQKFELWEEDLSGYFSTDFYRTDFQNQVFPDYDTDPTKAFVSNFTGKSVSNGFQAELSLHLWRRVEWKMGYNYLDVYRMVDGAKQVLPFNPRHKVLATLSYKPTSGRYHFDTNLHWYGRQRLPNTQANPAPFQRPDFSQPYTVTNVQFTYNFKKLSVYAGCENLFDFRQLQPILGWQDPFGPYFDTSSVWGPTRGREVYVGLRFRLEKHEKSTI